MNTPKHSKHVHPGAFSGPAADQGHKAAPTRTPETAHADLPAGGHLGGAEDPARAKYDQLQNGMTVDQANAILGVTGLQVTEANVGGMTLTTVQWSSPDLGRIIGSFENGSLVMKDQFSS